MRGRPSTNLPQATTDPTESPRATGRSVTRLVRARLEELLSLALAHRGWTARQLAAALDRCTGSVVPESGLPKIDLLIRLARVLDWPLETIVLHLSEDLVASATPDGMEAIHAVDLVDTLPGEGPEPTDSPKGAVEESAAPRELEKDAPTEGRWPTATPLRAPAASSVGATGRRRESGRRASAQELLRRGHEALAQGDAARGLRLASSAARRPEDRHLWISALALEADCWSALGQWDRAILPLQQASSSIGDQIEPAATVCPPTRPELLSRLARAYHRTGLWIEGGAVAGAALELPSGGDARSLAARAEALSLRVLCVRDGLEATGSAGGGTVAQALDAAQECLGILGWPAVLRVHPQGPCIRMMTEAASLELRVHAGQLSAGAAVARVLEGLEPWIDVDAVTEPAALAGAGWWCVLGFAIAFRNLHDPARQQALAILSNKADEIATAIGCSALRERVLRMEFELRTEGAAQGCGTDEWVLDQDDLRAVVRCIGTSRRFRPLGMEMLRQATLVLSEVS